MTLRTLLLALLLLGGTLATMVASADGVVFSGRAVWQLAQVVATSTRKTNQLSSAYRLPTRDGAPVIVPAANVFELLLRATGAWSQGGNFPDTVTMSLNDLKPPMPDSRYEPTLDAQNRPVLSSDLGNYAGKLLTWLETTHKLPTKFNFGETESTAYSLTAAQALTAYAVLIDTAIQQQRRPDAISVPMIHSPQDWSDISNPVEVIVPSAPPTPTSPGTTKPEATTETRILNAISAESAIAALKANNKAATAKAAGAHAVLLTGTPEELADANALLDKLDVAQAPVAHEAIRVSHITPSQAVMAVRAACPGISSVTQTSTGLVFIVGTRDKVDEAIAVVRKLDVPPPIVNTIVTLQWANPQQVALLLRDRLHNVTLQPSPPSSIVITGQQTQVDAAKRAIQDIDVEPPPRAEVHVVFNGTDLTAAAPAQGGQLPQPFCGIIHAEFRATGPVRAFYARLDNTPLCSFPGIGAHQFDINSPLCADGPHTLSVNVLDTQGLFTIYIFNFTTMNGRSSTINPIQSDPVNVDVQNR